MEAMRQSGTPEGLGRAQFLEGKVEALRDAVRDFVERNLLLFAKGDTEKFREELLKSARLSNLERRDLDRMRVLVRQMAKKLAARYAKTRRRRLRGQLDTRRTLRRNMGWGGVPFITVWKQKRIEKPRVMVLCDVSGSVAAMAQFLLMFLYALNEALSDIRSFAFSGSLMEVSDILEKQPVEEAITRIMSLIGFGSSNYGNSFADFEDGWMRFVYEQNNGHHAGRRPRQPDRPSDRHHWSLVATVETDHLAEPGISFRLGHRGFRHVSLRAILQSGDGVQHAAATGMGNHRYPEETRSSPRSERSCASFWSAKADRQGRGCAMHAAYASR